jgi:hypothetical protein
MSEFDLFKKKKKDKIGRDPDLFEDLDVDLDSDHPVHEEFVSNKEALGLRKIRKSRKI